MARVLEELDLVTPLTGLVINQYSDSEKLLAILRTLLGGIQVEIIAALDLLDKYMNLEIAPGVWLDYIGERLGFPRPEIDEGDYFGWKVEVGPDAPYQEQPGGDQNLGLGTVDRAKIQNDYSGEVPGGPLATLDGSVAYQHRTPLGDPRYRVLLRGRALFLRNSGNMESVIEILDNYFTRWTMNQQGAVGDILLEVQNADYGRAYTRLVIEHQDRLIPKVMGTRYRITELV